jgi:GDP-L-fucose synthase
MEPNARVYIAGHRGLVGSALVRALTKRGFTHLITSSVDEIDLRRQHEVEAFVREQQPDYIIIAAARVGGIHANATMPASFLYDNVMIATNCIEAAYKNKVKKLLFLGSSCIYPRDCLQPIKEEYLLTGSLESTNEAYAIAKIAGIKLCAAYRKQYGVNFISCMPTNLYGPGDNFDEITGHVIPALIARMVRAQEEHKQEVVIWGSGSPRRDVVFVDDCAEALIFLMDHYDAEQFLNIGSGTDYTIAELARMIQEIVGFEGRLLFDPTKPEGTPRKILAINRLQSLGWYPSISLQDGLKRTVTWYKQQRNLSSVQYSSFKDCVL